MLRAEAATKGRPHLQPPNVHLPRIVAESVKGAAFEFGRVGHGRVGAVDESDDLVHLPRGRRRRVLTLVLANEGR